MGIRKRDHLLAVAQRMFCEAGFHAVSVDSIVEDAGVARMTLYKNFGSKEDLISPLSGAKTKCSGSGL